MVRSGRKSRSTTCCAPRRVSKKNWSTSGKIRCDGDLRRDLRTIHGYGSSQPRVGRTLLSAAFALDVDFDLLDTKPNPNRGGQECPPHTGRLRLIWACGPLLPNLRSRRQRRRTRVSAPHRRARVTELTCLRWSALLLGGSPPLRLLCLLLRCSGGGRLGLIFPTRG